MPHISSTGARTAAGDGRWEICGEVGCPGVGAGAGAGWGVGGNSAFNGVCLIMAGDAGPGCGRGSGGGGGRVCLRDCWTTYRVGPLEVRVGDGMLLHSSCRGMTGDTGVGICHSCGIGGGKGGTGASSSSEEESVSLSSTIGLIDWRRGPYCSSSSRRLPPLPHSLRIPRPLTSRSSTPQ
jgi:hypothetical protein